MTHEQIDALPTGPEMDFAVATILKPQHAALHKPDNGAPYCELQRDRFRPSTDWNDAMFAAERFGLWTCGKDVGWMGGRFIQPPTLPNEPWRIGEWAETCQEVGSWLPAEPTGPLAISRAILVIAARKDQNANAT